MTTKRIWDILNVEENNQGTVGFLLTMSFLMGLFLAIVAVASQSYFLQFFSDCDDLPVAILFSVFFWYCHHRIIQFSAM